MESSEEDRYDALLARFEELEVLVGTWLELLSGDGDERDREATRLLEEMRARKAERMRRYRRKKRLNARYGNPNETIEELRVIIERLGGWDEARRRAEQTEGSEGRH